MAPTTNEQKREQRNKCINAPSASGAMAHGVFRHAWELFVSGDDEKRLEGKRLP